MRWLVGVFDVDPEQVKELFRSCGAAGGGPFHQPFWQVHRHTGSYVAHPHFMFFIGPAQPYWPPYIKAPKLPEWLRAHTDTDTGGLGRLVLSRPDQFGWGTLDHQERMGDVWTTWPHLHRVKQKAENPSLWREHIHMLRVIIESRARKKGAPAAKRQARNRLSKKVAQRRNRLRDRHGTGWAVASTRNGSPAAADVGEEDDEGYL